MAVCGLKLRYICRNFFTVAFLAASMPSLLQNKPCRVTKMLSRFEVSNFKNFRDKIVFDLSDTRSYEFGKDCIQNGIVSKALIYGPNASGKSNLGYAIFDIVSHLTDKQHATEHYENYHYAGSKSDLAEFVYEFHLNDDIVQYRYGKTSLEHIVYERLFLNGGLVASIDRRISDIATISLKGTENLVSDLEGSNVSIISYISKNSVLTDKQERKTFKAFIDFVNKMLFFRSLQNNNYIGLEQGSTSIGADIINTGLLEDFEGFLNEAGIDCKLGVIEDRGENGLAFDFNGRLVDFYDIASHGTRSLSLLYFWLQRIKAENMVSFVFVDEFDAFYHHNLARSVVERLRDTNVQVMITTHNTSIMSNDVLRPDCYFFLKNGNIKPLSDLTKKELRLSHNIEKMYKADAFNV